MTKKDMRFGYTFDDIILVPARSSVLPGEVDVRTKLSRNISLNIPVVSAAMDTVTESKTAITVARHTGDRVCPQEYEYRTTGLGGGKGKEI